MTAAGSRWETWAQGKELELKENGEDLDRFLAALSPLFSAPVRCVGISRSILPTSDADWRGGGLSWKQLLCQRRFSLVLSRLLWGWETFLERKTSCILTGSKERWPPVICSWDGLEAEWWLCFFCLLKFKIQPVRDKLTKAARGDFCLVPVLWTEKFQMPSCLTPFESSAHVDVDQNVRGVVFKKE